jgi:hypothetical protein
MKQTEKSALKKVGPNGGAREGAGRPAFEPTDAERKQVEALSGYGLPFEQIAVLVRDGIDADTLRKYFGNELISGKAKANGQIGQTLFQKAMGGDTTAMIWWSKTQMRWAETQKHEVTGADGAPLKVETAIDVAGLSVAALEELANLRKK